MAINLILSGEVLTNSALSTRHSDKLNDTDNEFQQLLQCFQQKDDSADLDHCLTLTQWSSQLFTPDQEPNDNFCTLVVEDNIQDNVLSVNEDECQLTPQKDEQVVDEESNPLAGFLLTDPIKQTNHFVNTNENDQPLSRIRAENQLLYSQPMTNQGQQFTEHFTERDLVEKNASLSEHIITETQRADYDDNIQAFYPKEALLSGDKTAILSLNNVMNLSTPLSPTPYCSNIPVAINDPSWSTSFNQQIIMFNRQAIQNAEITLNPQELGSLHIKLAMHDGKMQLQMITAYDVVKGVLEAALPQLRFSLAEQGIELQQADISHFSASEHSNQNAMGQHANRQQQPKISSTHVDPDTMPEIPAIAQSIMKHKGLSVFA